MSEKSKRGLGTGLSALFGEEISEDEFDGDLISLPITKVEPRAEQPRNRFDEEALKELADSISQYGLIQPITVRKLDSGYYQIIAGERRWRAARMAGLKEVPVRIMQADDRRTAELALVENLQREDLNPVEEALGYKSLIEEYGLTQEEAAKSVGRSRPAITNSLRLLNLCPNVLKMLEEGTLSAGHARALIPISDDEVQTGLAIKMVSEGLSVRKAEQLVARTIKQLEKPPQEDEAEKLIVDYVAETADMLSRSLNRKVNIDMGKRGGKIILEFYGSEDREALISNLSRMGKSWEDIIT